MLHRRSSRRITRWGLLLLCGALLALLLALMQGCQPSGADPPIDAYLRKLGAALSLKPPGSQSGRVLPSPLTDAMQLPIAANDLDRLDILALRDCEVQGNIIRRDTSLARRAKPSQQLLLALEYLRLAPPCIEQLRGRDEVLAARLQDAWEQQQAQLPALIFNATLGGDEYGAFWRAAPVAGGYPRVSARETAAALHNIQARVRRWLSGNYRAQDRDFELWLAAVAGGTGGAHWQALYRRSDALAAADRMVTRRGVSAMRCGESVNDNAGTRLPLQLRTAFRRDVLPTYSHSLQRYRNLLHPVAALEEQLEAVLPPTYLHWMEDRSQSLDAIVAAPQRHLQRLEQLRQACATE